MPNSVGEHFPWVPPNPNPNANPASIIKGFKQQMKNKKQTRDQNQSAKQTNKTQITTNQNAEFWSPVPVSTSTKHSPNEGSRNIGEVGGGRL